MKKIWIDTDPGVDDIFAIAMLFASKKFDILGISSVFGNATIDHTTKNSKIILEAVGRENIPIARGSCYPIHVPLDTSPFVHGENGLGNMELHNPRLDELPVRAPQAIINAILANPNDITIFAIGPLTNLAIAYLIEPKIASLVDEVIIMGGAVHVPGNITPTAEANFFHDPHAAQTVISAGWPITLAGLDVCGESSMISNALLKKVCASTKPLAPYIKGALPFYQDFIKKFGIHDKVDFPDALAAAYLIEPDIFSIEPTPLFIETEGSCLGQSVPVPHHHWYQDIKNNTHYRADDTITTINVMVKLESEKFFRLVEQLLT